jgi:DNA-binding transcriptional MerR regulator
VAKERHSIGAVAKRTGISVKTLRFYADEGIVPPSGRSESGYRLYSDTDVTRLELVRALRDAGLGLKEVRAVLARDMTLADALRLPDEPTPEQVDAWVELAEMVSDPTFVESLRTNAKEVWQRGIDMERMQALNNEVVAAAAAARAAGTAPESDEAAAIVERYLAGLAGLAGDKDPRDPAFRAGVRQRFARQDPRASRYWELVGILNGRHPMSGHVAEWRWVVQALLHHLPT